MQCRFLSFILFHIDSLIKKKDHPRVDPISFLIRDHPPSIPFIRTDHEKFPVFSNPYKKFSSNLGVSVDLGFGMVQWFVGRLWDAAFTLKLLAQHNDFAGWHMGMSQNRNAPSSLFLVKKEGLGAFSYGTPILRHSHMLGSEMRLSLESCWPNTKWFCFCWLTYAWLWDAAFTWKRLKPIDSAGWHMLGSEVQLSL